jgi:sugar lactone lactonase YvrE
MATSFSQSFTITTIAGFGRTTGTNDGPGSSARFNFPNGIVADSNGNLFVADGLNHTIRKVSPVGTNWVVSTIAGFPGVTGTNDGLGSQALLNRPDGVALDNAGNLYFADRYNATIRRLTPIGTNWFVSTLAGMPGVIGTNDGVNGEARFWLPSGIAVDKAGNIYVADASNFMIRKVAPFGTNWVVTTITGSALIYGSDDGTNSDALFDYPKGIALDPAGNLYVADWGNDTIRKLAPAGTNWVVTTLVGSAGVMGSADGTNTSALFNLPIGITVDRQGNLLVTDQSNNTIRRIAPVGNDWVVTTLAGLAGAAGTNDGPGNVARFRNPWGITTDGYGNLFVVDYSNDTIRMGILPSTNAPALQIKPSINQVVLSWPLWAAGFTLESSASVSAGALWTPITNGVSANANCFALTNSAGAAAAYYRLRGP